MSAWPELVRPNVASCSEEQPLRHIKTYRLSTKDEMEAANNEGEGGWRVDGAGREGVEGRRGGEGRWWWWGGVLNAASAAPSPPRPAGELIRSISRTVRDSAASQRPAR